MSQNRVKIHIINRYFSPVQAGIEVLLFQLFRHFDSKKFSVTMHVSANTLSQQNILPTDDKKENIAVKRYKTIKNFFLPKVPFQSTDALFLTNFTLFPHLLVLFSISVQKMLGVKKFKYIFFPCGGFTPDWETFPPAIRTIKQLLHKSLGANMINYSAHKVVAISQWEKQKLINAGILPNLIALVPLGIESEAFAPINNNDISEETKRIAQQATPYIIQVARIHPIKNIDTTIKSLALMENPFTYIVVGEIENKEYMKTLKDLITEKNLTKKVIFTGRISKADKYYLIDKSIAMVHLSHNESFGLSVHEGMSRGKICIAANNSALPEAVTHGQNGYIIPTEDAGMLADKLAFLQTGEGKTATKIMEKYNKKEMIRYKWEKVAQTVQQIIQMKIFFFLAPDLG